MGSLAVIAGLLRGCYTGLQQPDRSGDLDAAAYLRLDHGALRFERISAGCAGRPIGGRVMLVEISGSETDW